jgi:hypothetical protein
VEAARREAGGEAAPPAAGAIDPWRGSAEKEGSMNRLGGPVLAGLALALLGFAGSADAASKKLKVTQLARGSVDDAKLQKEAPKDGVVADSKALEKLWKAWKVSGKIPKVDFRKEVVVVVTTGGGRLLPLNATLSEEGDLKFVAGATRDVVPGFRYVIGSVPRAGVKTINGKKPGK